MTKYIVDVATDLVRKIGNSEPVMFQSYASLFVVSGSCFAQLSYGVPPDPKNELTSEDNLSKEEMQFMKAICFSNTFCLKDVTEAGKALAELPDDEKIRLARFDGHCAWHDRPNVKGTNLYVQQATTMDREEYMATIKTIEHRMRERYASRKVLDPQKSDDYIHDAFLPDIIVISPSISLGFPNHKAPYSSWNSETTVHDKMNGGEIHRHSKIVCASIPDKFAVRFTQNNIEQEIRTKEDLKEIEAHQIEMKRQEDCLESVLDDFNEIAAEMNEAHNRICAKIIERHRR